ncbi:MAG: hypothetical protein HOU81_01085 [Hamadaea sp.]|uniref:hypothetical protein n=1 Tax=Hamadaea sp. TaxID=2024425 RepID=UPI0018188399|nr:hypothetical protein [Hamadaea sp.]NUR69392.1 hypothetical protein [Hamadaea sp.]NUT23209.1 hypothetical protein [Hamadaea sp.]
MADRNANPLLSTEDLVVAVKAFASAHGGARAAVEYLGKRGALVIVTGADGEATHLPTTSIEVARDACDQAGVAVDNGWDNELTDLIRPSNDLWRSRGRSMSR